MDRELVERCQPYEQLIDAFDEAGLTAGEIRSVAKAVEDLESGTVFSIKVVVEQ